MLTPGVAKFIKDDGTVEYCAVTLNAKNKLSCLANGFDTAPEALVYAERWIAIKGAIQLERLK